MKRLSSALFLLASSCFAFSLLGYHPGAEDDAVYLSGVKKVLTPGLYPYNARFITLQLQATVFPRFVALLCRLTHLPVEVVSALLQWFFLWLLLVACWRLLAQCFATLRARVAGVLAIACLCSLSVAGTALYLVDEHLHPRLIATDAILLGLDALLRNKKPVAVAWLLVACAFHPIMAAFGVSLFFFVLVRERILVRAFPPLRVAAALPFSWVVAPGGSAWHSAMAQHSYYRLGGWQWYEWLGAVAPPFLLMLLARLAARRQRPMLARLSSAVALYSVAQFAVALAMLLPPSLVRLTPLQPMRYLHLTFLLMFLLWAGALGEWVLSRRLLPWLAIFIPLAAVNGYAQRIRYPGTQNLELPGRPSNNNWVQAFRWVRSHTPTDAVFALDPNYLALPGEDNHSFRALAERSSLVDAKKDAAVATQVPSLAGEWLRQRNAQAGWEQFTRDNFAALARS